MTACSSRGTDAALLGNVLRQPFCSVTEENGLIIAKSRAESQGKSGSFWGSSRNHFSTQKRLLKEFYQRLRNSGPMPGEHSGRALRTMPVVLLGLLIRNARNRN